MCKKTRGLTRLHFSYYSIVTSAVEQWNSMEKWVRLKPLEKTYFDF